MNVNLVYRHGVEKLNLRKWNTNRHQNLKFFFFNLIFLIILLLIRFVFLFNLAVINKKTEACLKHIVDKINFPYIKRTDDVFLDRFYFFFSFGTNNYAVYKLMLLNLNKILLGSL